MVTAKAYSLARARRSLGALVVHNAKGLTTLLPIVAPGRPRRPHRSGGRRRDCSVAPSGILRRATSRGAHPLGDTMRVPLTVQPHRLQPTATGCNAPCEVDSTCRRMSHRSLMTASVVGHRPAPRPMMVVVSPIANVVIRAFHAPFTCANGWSGRSIRAAQPPECGLPLGLMSRSTAIDGSLALARAPSPRTST